MLRIFSPVFSTSFFSPFLGLSPRMSAFLVLQFGMSAASVHCCYTVSPRIESCMLCDKFVHLSFYFQNLCSLPGMAVDSGRPDTILFSLISFRSPSLGFELLRQFWRVFSPQLFRQENAELRGELHKLRAQMPQAGGVWGLATWDFGDKWAKLGGEEPWGESAKTWTLGKPITAVVSSILGCGAWCCSDFDILISTVWNVPPKMFCKPGWASHPVAWKKTKGTSCSCSPE